MIVVMNPGVSQADIDMVTSKLKELGFGVHLSQGEHRTIIGAIGDRKKALSSGLEALPCVEKIVPISQPFKLVSRDFKAENSVYNVGGVEIGGDKLVVMAGPCAVESREQLLEAARQVKAGGATILRGGAFKPRTSPYSFQGLEEEGLKFLAQAREETGLLIVTEVMNQHTVDMVAEYADILQVGARSMQNFYLLKEIGRTDKPVLLKRGLSATIEEWLMAAEYIMSEGNYRVILCERGIRTFETYTRNTLDLSCVPVIKRLSHLPIFVDPSHGTGSWHWVPAMSKAALAAGADGLIVEVHPNPAEAMSDGPQSLNPENFKSLMSSLKDLAPVLGRQL
jgi:3-deoxy-7-phosphoheptulonate synthase